MSNPTHRHKATGALVFPDGYRASSLKPLPETFWHGAEIAMLIAEIKAESSRRIEAISPLWRQTNDIRKPSDAGAARFAAIDAVRAWSSGLELDASHAHNAAAIGAIRTKLNKP